MPQVELPAGTIHYEDTGGDGRVVVLLHGLIMDHTQWREVLPHLGAYRCVLPTLPMGAHRTPMKPDADLQLPGMVNLVADFLDALDLRDVTLVCTDWGGGMLLTHFGRDQRVARLILCPCEAFDNYPPGLPGKMAVLAVRMPGGIKLALRQLRIGWLRRTPLLFGWMAKHGVPQDVIEGWTAPGIASREIRRDLKKYATSPFVGPKVVEMTESLRDFKGKALILWASEDKVMPREHGRRLAELIPDARLVEVPDSYVLMQFDNPRELTRHMLEFLEETRVAAAA
jgi:pimeloyl-ACP methyl ester carboxylesterase